MPEFRRFPRAVAPHILLTAALVAVYALVLSSACSRSQRTDTIHATFVAVNGARDGFAVWDKNHQHAIMESARSREEGRDALARYREAQRPAIVEGFVVAYQTLAAAATASDDPSLKGAVAAAMHVIDAVKALTGGAP